MKEVWRDKDAVELKSDISGKELRGGTKTVDRDPLLVWLELLLIVRIVRIDPVGERVTDTESGTETGLLTASLLTVMVQQSDETYLKKKFTIAYSPISASQEGSLQLTVPRRPHTSCGMVQACPSTVEHRARCSAA